MSPPLFVVVVVGLLVQELLRHEPLPELPVSGVVHGSDTAFNGNLIGRQIGSCGP